MKNLIVIITLSLLSAPGHADQEFDAEKFKEDLNQSANYFSFGLEANEDESSKIPKQLTKKRQAEAPVEKNSEFADLESTYFDKISTKASATEKTDSKKLKRAR